MSSSPINHAAVIPRACAHPMSIEQVPYPTAGAGELVIQVGAIAINPIDSGVQALGNNIFPWLQYPFVNGYDIAGTIVEVGSNVTGDFAKGDRVLALRGGFSAREGAFQEYVVVLPNITTKIPDSLSFTEAAVLPLGVATAAGALYEPGTLELDLPTIETVPKSRKQVVLVWGGSSSVGTNAIQLAVGSGYEVFTTCSPHNFDLCQSLGASQAFDYNSPNVVADIIGALRGKTIAGAITIFQDSFSAIYEILASNEVQGSKKIGSAVPQHRIPPPPEGITAKGVFAGTIKDNHIGAAVYNDYLAKALASGAYQAQPPALVVGKGLTALQIAVDQIKDSKISAKKLVVSLEEAN